MSGKVNVRLETDPSCQGTEVIIRAVQQTELTDRIVSAIEHCLGNEYPPIAAYQGDILLFVNQTDIIRVYTANRKLILCAKTGRYELRLPLKELEDRLDKERFVRISRFEIINLQEASGFDFSNTGTIRVLFRDGSETWVARRYVQSIQQTLKRIEEGGGGLQCTKKQ